MDAVFATGDLIANKYRVVSFKGNGASSQVYEVIQEGLGIKRALKVLAPSHENVQPELFEKTFESEIQILSQLSHKNIISIIDYGHYSLNCTIRKYYVMEFVQGATLDEASNALNDPEIALSLIQDILDGLVYIHERPIQGNHILHFDIKPKNIFVVFDDKNGLPIEAKIGDLGVAKSVAAYAGEQSEIFSQAETYTHVFGSYNYSPKYAREYINNSEMPIQRLKLSEWYPHYDLYTLGATLAEVVSRQKIQTLPSVEVPELLKHPKLAFQRLPPGQWDYLKRFIQTLVEENPDDCFGSAAEALEVFQRLDPRRAIPWRSPELTKVGSSYSIAHHGRLSLFTERTFSLLSHPCFQRLQRINQLAFAEFVYPGARHSRLIHCIDTFELARDVIQHLLGDSCFRFYVGPDSINLFLCAALLHDIGHYPLAHIIEDLRAAPSDSVNSGSILSDFEMAQYFLDRPWPNSGSLSDILLDRWQIKSDKIASIINSYTPDTQLTMVERLLRTLLDGPFDIDKISYLRLDSAATGVPYGTGIDVSGLFDAMSVLPPEDPHGFQIVIELQGLSAAESVIIARYHMFLRVYWHRTNRAIMAMTRYVALKVFFSGRISFLVYIENTLTMNDLEAASYLSRTYQEIDDKAFNPLAGLMDGNRAIYKRLLTFSDHSLNPDTKRIHKYLSASSQAEQEAARLSCVNAIACLLERPVDDAELLFDIPRVEKDHDSVSNAYIHDPIGELKEIRRVSNILEVVSNDFQTLAKKSRIFVQPKLRDELRIMGKEDEARKAIVNLLKELVRNSVIR